MRSFAFSVLFACGVAAGLAPAVAEPAYQKPTIVAAQEALVRLGYDIGKVDGAWRAKTRDALNELRAKNGLPAAPTFTGSSLALIHKASPGATTLPHPGLLVTDIEARREFLATPDATRIRMIWCPASIGRGRPPQSYFANPVATITTAAGAAGFITQDEDWYSPLLEGLTAAHGQCVAGKDDRCSAIVELLKTWAAADAIKPGAKRGQQAFQDNAWIGNILLRNFILSYASARSLTPVPTEDETLILDWFKRRIDDYHYIKPGNETSNHAMAAMTPALVFGALVGDRSMMEPAFGTWRTVLKSMRRDGSLPMETRRGARSLHYTNIQIGQLIGVAKVAESQGIDLYATAPNALQKALGFLIDAYQNFDKVSGYAKANFGPGPSNDYTIPYLAEHHFGWLPAYYVRFGDDEIMARLRTTLLDVRICSPRAKKERKLSNPSTCAWSVDGKLGLGMTIAALGLTPLHHMGYPAGCLQGTEMPPLTATSQ